MNMTLDILQCLADPKEMMAEGHVGTIRSAAGSKPSGEGIGAAHSCVPSVSYHRFLLQMLLCPALYCPDLQCGQFLHRQNPHHYTCWLLAERPRAALLTSKTGWMCQGMNNHLQP